MGIQIIVPFTRFSCTGWHNLLHLSRHHEFQKNKTTGPSILERDTIIGFKFNCDFNLHQMVLLSPGR
jgi:hypothetical protein